MKFLICFALIVQVIVLATDSEVEHNGFYSVIGSIVLRPNSNYHVSITIYDDILSKISVNLSGSDLNKTETISVQPFSTELVKFQIPNIKGSDYVLTVEGIDGIIFKKTSNLHFDDKYFNAYIIMDKTIYKPGDLIRFRVAVFDELTRPLKLDYVVITISDAQQNRIKQIKKAKLIKGIYNGELQLSEFPIMGIWEIQVLVGRQLFTKKFEIIKYVLPKFDVQIETASNIVINEKIRGTIRSTYTYGKPVKGSAKINFVIGHSFNGKLLNKLKENLPQKIIPIDGKAFFDFDINLNNLEFGGPEDFPSLKLIVEVEDELTALKYNATKTLTLHAHMFDIKPLQIGLSWQWTYIYDEPIQIGIIGKLYDGSPIQDIKNPVALETVSNAFSRVETRFDGNGIAKFKVTVSSAKWKNFFVPLKIVYLGKSFNIRPLMKRKPEPVKILSARIKTERPRLNQDVVVQVSSNNNLPDFYYEIIGRGNIIISKKVEVTGKQFTQEFNFLSTFEMMPSADIFIYFVNNGTFHFTEIQFDLEHEFENFINIEIPKEAKPSDDIDIRIVTHPDSSVGLKAVDQSVLLLKDDNDFSANEVMEDLKKFNRRNPMKSVLMIPKTNSGLFMLTNTLYHDNRILPNFDFTQRRTNGFLQPRMGSTNIVKDISVDGESQTPIKIIERKVFPETWIWFLDNNVEDGEFSIRKKVPDTITSWIFTGFSLNEKYGLGLTKTPSKLKVFMPFFISTNLPYSVKQGEVISIPVIVFNYMENNVNAEIVFDNAAKEFDFAEATNEVEEKTSDDLVRMKRLTVPGNSGKSVSFMIRPKKVGHVTIKLKATTPLAGDAIEQILLVEPDGVTQYVNKPILIILKDEHNSKEEIHIDIPEDIVPNSEHIEVSIIGDLLGPIIENLDKLIRLPYGCGEQNMINFVPNILVLKYLTNVGELTAIIESKANGFLEIGFQRELTYKHDDGSFSAFGKSDGHGSTWLTAYVMRSFHQAKSFIDIDDKIIDKGLEFLAKLQSDDGRFSEHGKIIDKAHAGDSENGLALTAFVLLAFIENKDSRPNYETNIQSGLEFLKKNIDSNTDLYTLTIVSYVMKLADDKIQEKLIEKLNSLAKVNGDRKWWAKELDENNTEKTENILINHAAKSNDVEMTSYALLASLTDDNVLDSLPIVKWLISQRNNNGGFGSTQDTVVGLTALMNFAQKFSTGRTNMMDIEFNDDAGTKHAVSINNDNSWELQTHVLPTSARKIDINAKGNGSALIQVSNRYNLFSKPDKTFFDIKIEIDKSTGKLLKMKLCFNYKDNSDDFNKKKDQPQNAYSNMAIAEINLPSGYTVDRSDDSLTELQNTEHVKRIETKNQNTVLIIYFDNLSENDVCTPIMATRTSDVAKQKPVAVEIYDYYDTKKRGIIYYEVNSSLCDICSDDECGAGC